jgi:hypothetical protein
MTVAWTWDSCRAVTMAIGFGVVGVKNLLLLIYVCRTDSNEEFAVV